MTKTIHNAHALGKSLMQALTMLLLVFSAANAQTTWTGTLGSDWNDPGNWSNGVPDANTVTVIANTGVTASIGQNVEAQAKSVLVQPGATLDIAAQGMLTISSSDAYNTPFTFNYTAALNNQGTVTNSGKLVTGTSSAVYGIVNLGSFHNKPGAEIRIDNTSDTGLYNASGTFTNEAAIVIGADVSVGYHGIWNDATFDNDGGSIQIDRSSLRALMNNADAGKSIAAVFNNSAIIEIGTIAGAGDSGIENRSAFINKTGAAIRIDRTNVNGLYHALGTFGNAGSIAIGTDAAAGSFGLKSESAFTNNSTGEIRINRVTKQGLSQRYATLENSGTITIGDLASAGVTGIVSPSFTNNAGGKVFVDRTTESAMALSNLINHGDITLGALESVGSYGITCLADNTNNGHIRIDRASKTGIQADGRFDNSAKITIGGQASMDNDGITVRGTFNNLSGGGIRIQRTAYSGLNVPSGSFVNEADLTIGADGGTGLWGIVAQGSIENKGNIHIDGASEYGIYVFLKGVFSNSGPITIGGSASAGKYGIYNWARFYNNAGGDISIDRSENAALMNFEGEFTNDGKITVGGIAGVGTYGLVNRGPFKNNAGAEVHIDRSSDTGLYSYSIAGFDNAGTVTIGANEAVGAHGIFNETAFNNLAGGTIRIDRSSLAALRNFNGSFNNSADIMIGGASAVGTYGIRNQSDFANNGGNIKIDNASEGILAEDKTFTNAGTITVGQTVAIANLITRQGTGVFLNSTGGILKGSGQIAAAGFTHAGGTLSPGYSPGIINFTADQDFTSSILDMEINGNGTPGVDFDQIVVSGTATLGGTLAITATYTPVQTDQLVLLTANAVTGTFSSVTGLDDKWDVVYTASTVKLVRKDPMPVTLVRFDVELNGPSALLRWQTTEETDNAGFYIERSKDGRQWEDIGFVKGSGTGAAVTTYRFEDNAPQKGLNYYRLRQIDFDGTIAYSRIRAARLSGQGAAELVVWADASRNARVMADATVTRITAYNLQGSVIATSEGAVLNLSHVPSWLVLVRVWTDESVTTRKLMLP